MPVPETPTAADAALLAIARAEALGWRTITIRRLRALAVGDLTRMPPDPATAPPSSRSVYWRGDQVLPALLNGNADRDVAVRTAALAEAATAAEALIPALQREYPEEPSNSPWCCGVKDAAAEIRRIADLPTA